MQTCTFFALALCIAQTFADVKLPGCNQDTIDIINSYWEDNGTPDNIIDSLVENGKGTLLYSTEVVPVKVHIEEPKCVKGEFTKDTAKFTVIPRKGTLEAAKSTVYSKLSEKDGIITEDGGKVTKYIIANQGGVTAFYTCNPTGGDSDAGPAVGLAVAIKKFKSAKKIISSLKGDLEELGFDLQTTYGKACTK